MGFRGLGFRFWGLASPTWRFMGTYKIYVRGIGPVIWVIVIFNYRTLVATHEPLSTHEKTVEWRTRQQHEN